MRHLDDESAPMQHSVQRDADSILPDRLGWLLVDTLKDQLPERALSGAYVHLGCRHYRRAIGEALQATAATGTAIPDVLAAEIACWLDAYDGHPDQERITQLLARTKRGAADGNLSVPRRRGR
jgi:hypothetical protein